MSKYRKAMRINNEEEKVLTYSELIEELEFQIYEDYISQEEHAEYNLDNNSNISFEDFAKLKLKELLNTMEEGYSVSIMGDEYYFLNN